MTRMKIRETDYHSAPVGMSSTAASSTALLILTQVASRALTFIGNQVVLRYSSPTLLGITVQLELVSVTILYFARESLRVALQRQPRAEVKSTDKKDAQPKEAADLQGAINTSYLAVLLGLILGAVSFGYYGSKAPIEVTKSPGFSTAYQYYIFATLAELLSEPFFIVIQQQGLFRARAAAETRAAIARCLTACAVAFYTHRTGQPPSVLPFAAGQLAYGLTLFVLYLVAAQRATEILNFSLTPSSIPSAAHTHILDLIPGSLLSLSLTLYAQSTFKLLLTQGDALLLSVLAPLASQGAFALVSNYGGLLARLVFQPVEESNRNTFGRLLSTNTSEGNTSAALGHLAVTLRVYSLASLPVLVLAPPLLPALTPLILAARWRNEETVALLQSYIYYLPLTALNGILDAFVTSVATPKQLHLQSLSMIFFTALYGLAAWWFLIKLELGPQGLVWAGMVAMLGRVGYGGWFVRGWISKISRTDQSLASSRKAKVAMSKFDAAATPKMLSVAIAVGVWAALRLFLADGQVESLKRVDQIGIVSLGAVILGLVMLMQERAFLLGLVQSVIPRRIREKLPAPVNALISTNNRKEGDHEEKKEL